MPYVATLLLYAAASADTGWRVGHEIELPVAGTAVDEVEIAALR
jgi:hypothetical protein